MNLPKDILDIHKVFTNNGFKLFVVGGATRDFIMGKTPHDFDLVTDAEPNEVMSILKEYNTDLQGAQFGVVRVFTDTCKEGHEIASYRKDISIHQRDNKSDDVKVEVGKHITIEDDVLRRDLSINSLFYDIETKEVIDLVGGIDDIKNKIIRTVGNPIDRFNEDRLRILRTCRFSATMGFKLHVDTCKALLSDSRLFGVSDVDDVSKERIYAEFYKVVEKVKSNNDTTIMETFFDMLLEYNIIQQFFPQLNYSKINPTGDLSIAIAQLLKHNRCNDELIKILTESKISNTLLNNVTFFIDIFDHGIYPANAYKFHKRMTSKNIDIKLVEEWINIIGGTDDEVKFLRYTPTTNGTDVIKDGFKGTDIGDEIIRRECKLFQQLK